MKLVEYLPNLEHERGGSKAVLLQSFGYTAANWHQFAADLRRYHLAQDVTLTRQSPYGMRYEIRAILQTPGGRSLMLRSIWQIDAGMTTPRLITAYPD